MEESYEEGLATYRYRALDSSDANATSITINLPRKGDLDFAIHTRIIELLPGELQDPLIITGISHEALKEVEQVPVNQSFNLEKLNESLLDGWEAHRTTQGKTLFSSGDTTSWEPPDPNIQKWQYEEVLAESKIEPNYDAISYAWGSSARSKSILVRNARPRDEARMSPTNLAGATFFRMTITPSLYGALQHLRHTKRPRKIWADAICIDQQCDPEKAHQVQHMGDIYRLANRVIVWLGEEADDSGLALSTLEHLGSQVEYDMDLRKAFDPPNCDEKGWGKPSFRLPYDHKTWTAIEKLLDRDWFKRLWVVQEIQLSNRYPGGLIQCGADIISASAFRRAIICLYTKLATIPVSLHWAVIRGYDMMRPKSKLIFHRIVEQICFNQLCKDERDKIFGILSLVPQRFARTIIPDYRSTCTVDQVYRSAVVNHASHVQRLELWGHFSLIGKNLPNLPSWVPDWSIPSPVRRQMHPQFAASTSRCHITYDKETPAALSVTGVRCATVTKVVDYLPKGASHSDAVDHVRNWTPTDLDTAIYSPTGETLRRAYAFTLICGDVQEEWPGTSARTIAEWEKQDYVDALFGDRSTTPQGASSAGSEISPSVYRALEFCRGRTFFRTTEGYCGLAPAGIAEGDLIAVFLGCKNPVVLRASKNSYLFLGECFVPGLQGATSLLGPLPKPWKLITTGYGPGGRDIHYFLNTETGHRTVEDPRLSPTSTWERIEKDFDGDDPENHVFFQHESTGEIISYDPRLEPNELRARGIQLETFTMV